MEFYTYLWLRDNGTPYYVGKGTGIRAFRKHGVHLAPPRERIVVYPAKDESEAFENEIALIWYFGRRDLGTGCLRNFTDGGENPPNWKGKTRPPMTAEHRMKLSKAKLGKSNPNKGKSFSEEARRNMSLARKGKPSPNKGKRLSEEARRNMQNAPKGNRKANSGSFSTSSVPWNKGMALSLEERRIRHNEASRKYYRNIRGTRHGRSSTPELVHRA